METYQRVRSIQDLFLEKDAQRLSIFLHLLRLTFFYLCFVLLPTLVLLTQISLGEGTALLVLKFVLSFVVGAVLSVIFIAFSRMQAYHYKQFVMNQVASDSSLNLSYAHCLYSLQYAALFDFGSRKLALASHQKKIYLLKNFSDIESWKMQALKTPKSNKSMRIYGKYSNVLILQVKDHDQSFALSFKLRKKQAQTWIEHLGETIPNRNTRPDTADEQES